eukprot:47906_1
MSTDNVKIVEEKLNQARLAQFQKSFKKCASQCIGPKCVESCRIGMKMLTGPVGQIAISVAGAYIYDNIKTKTDPPETHHHIHHHYHNNHESDQFTIPYEAYDQYEDT